MCLEKCFKLGELFRSEPPSVRKTVTGQECIVPGFNQNDKKLTAGDFTDTKTMVLTK